MSKRIAFLIGGVFVVLLITGGIFYYLSSTGKLTFQKPVTFELQPQKIRGEVEIEPDTSFIVKSSQKVNPTKLQESFVIEPKVEMTIQAVDDTTFEVKPKEELTADTVYTVAIGLPLATKKQSWAYQVIAPFNVLSTIPGNEVNGVPVNTGIEITLNRETAPFQEYFEISPAIAGTYEQKEEKLIFVPQQPLAYKTIYTVKLKKGLKEKDGPDVLFQDNVFIFETESEKSIAINTPYLGFQRSFWEFVPSQAPVFGLSSDNVGEARFKIYKFKNHEDFLQEYSRLSNETEPWSSYHDTLNFSVSPDQKIFDAKLKVEQLDYSSYVAMPQKLPVGFYGVEAYFGDELQDITWVQVSPLIGFSAVSGSNSIVWIKDHITKEGIENATVSYRGHTLGTTDIQGLATFSTPLEQVAGTPEFEKEDPSKYPFAIVTHGSNTLLLSLFNSRASQKDEWWTGLTVDKPIYLPSDTIHFWGFAKRRDDTDIRGNELKVQIRDAYDYSDDENAYVETTARIGSSHTFIGKLDYTSLRPGYYSLVVSYQGKTVVSQEINIQTYVKPAYSISVQPDKEAAFVGEKISYTVKANFFDGTPVAGLQVSYSDPDSTDETGKSLLELNGDGEGVFTSRAASYQDNAGRGESVMDTTSVEPSFSEEAQIEVSTYVLAFPARQIMSVDPTYDTKKTNFSLKLHSVDIAKGLAAGGGTDDESYFGSPVADHPISVKVTRIEYRKKLQERKYDPFTKTTYPVYDYDRISKELPRSEIRTNISGEAQFSWEGDEKYSYSVKFETEDEKGVTIFAEHSVFTRSIYESYNAPLGITLSSDEPNKNYYKLQDPIRLSVKRNDGTALKEQEGRYLYLRTVNEMISPFVSDSPSYRDTFTEKYIPNVEVIAVWFSGDRFYHTYDYWYGVSSIGFDSADRKLSISLKKDRERYRPRETVKLSVDVKDPKGQPRKAHVLVSAIDEALKTFGETPTLEPQIYRQLTSRLVLHSTHEHPIASGAEGGGCFVADTSILTPSGEKPIQDLKEGDYVLTKASLTDPTLIPARIYHVSSHTDDEYISINGSLSLTPNHRLLVNNKWQRAGVLKVGDKLLDTNNSFVAVTSVSRNKTLQRVYNIEIENQHTFFADGIYVHNQEKGGGEGGAPRTDFKDTVYFQTVDTNEQGHAEVSFAVPDNLTSWALKAEAITPDLYIGVEEIGVPVSLPFFVDATLNKTYLAQDQLTLRLRTFGTAVPAGLIKYKVESPTLPFKSIEKEGGKSIELPLGTLTAGLHTLSITASAGTSTDTLVRTVDVRETYFIQTASDYRSLKSGEESRFDSAASLARGYVRLSACSCDRSRYQSLLSWLRYAGVRLDEQAASAVAAELEKKYFGDVEENSDTPSDIDLIPYQSDTGGFSIVRHGGDDLYSSALVAHAARFSNGMLYSKEELISYLYTSLYDVKADRTRQVYALWGLAALREPILVDLQPYLTDPQTTLEERVYIASALATLGAKEKAREYYQSSIKSALIEQKPFLYVRGLKGTDTDLRVTAVLAYLLSALQEDTAAAAGGYIFEYDPRETRIDLERALYLGELLPTFGDEEGVFEYQTSKGAEMITLHQGDSFHRNLTPQELSQVVIRAKKGALNISLIYDVVDATKKSSTDSTIQIQRSYKLQGDKRFTELHNGDIVKVTLSPKIDKSVQGDAFEITDYVPSGLRIVESAAPWGYEDTYSDEELDSGQDRGYPFLVDGQRIVFDWYKDKDQRPFYYYARVVSQGTYRAESAQIQSVLTTESANYSSEESVTIK